LKENQSGESRQGYEVRRSKDATAPLHLFSELNDTTKKGLDELKDAMLRGFEEMRDKTRKELSEIKETTGSV
jgi:hypothetical protein